MKYAFLFLVLIFGISMSHYETVRACDQNLNKCYRLRVETSGDSIKRINLNKWINVTASDCSDKVCFALDENNTQWVIDSI